MNVEWQIAFHATYIQGDELRAVTIVVDGSYLENLVDSGNIYTP